MTEFDWPDLGLSEQDVVAEALALICQTERMITGTVIRGEPRVLAALAAMARLRRLLGAMCELAEDGFHDVLSVVGRSSFEYWLIGMYLLIGGDPAVSQLHEQFIHNARRIVGDDDGGALAGQKGQPLRVSELVDGLASAMRQVGHPLCEMPESLHRIVYRADSTFGVHGSLSSVMAHVQSTADGHKVELTRRLDYDDGIRSIKLSSLFVESLAEELVAAGIQRQ